MSNCRSSNQDPGMYFLNLVRQLAAGRTSSHSDEEEEAPTELNTINSSGGFLVVTPDKLSIKYTGMNRHGHDVGVVQANKPAPSKRLVYYFEIYVQNAGEKGQIAIGFTNEGFKMRRQPGWEANSFGYHGDDGMLYRGHGKGESFGPTYTAGDVVGGGIIYASQEFFFVKNGSIVGRVHKDIKGPLFPTVAVHSQNEEVLVNFGQKPFSFDVQDLEAQERRKQQKEIEKTILPPDISYEIIRSYLLYYGYEDTLNSFDIATRNTVPPVHVAYENSEDERNLMYALNHRKTLRLLIRSGQIDAALGKLREWYPQIVQDDKSTTSFLLHSQKFIEFIRGGALQEAVSYGRSELAKFVHVAEFADIVKDCVALLAYEKPQETSVGYLLEESQRDVVADTVNAMILLTNPQLGNSKSFSYSYLEKVLRQLTTCCMERRLINGNQGETFHLHKLLNSCKKTEC